MDGCTKFSYWPDSSDCYFSDDQAELQPSRGAVAGLGVCPPPTGQRREVCRREVPGNGFPGFTGKASHSAWPSGKQPRSLECWPRNDTGGYMACKQVTVLEDTTSGWPGKCRGLTKHNGSFAQCAEDCKQNPLCPAWQTGQYGCWQGLGNDCFVRVEFTPLRAQRIQHGSVRVLWNLTGWQIVGLSKAFDNQHGYFIRDADAISACKKVCYSDIRCQYWQYSRRYGCWVEDASQGFRPPWPLTTEWAYRSTQFALDCVAGEYIQHSCPEGMATPFTPLAQERLSSCMSLGYSYDPPDMRWQGHSVEMSAEHCQERCRNTRGCRTFAYNPDGICHLQDKKSARVVAKHPRVVSGPAVCAEQPAATTPAPQVLPSTTVQRGPMRNEVITVAEIMVNIQHLAWSTLGNNTQDMLRLKYTEVMAEQLGVPTTKIRRRPKGPAGSVLVSPSSTGSDVDGSSDGTLLLAYTVNQPRSSRNVSRIKGIVDSRVFKQALVRGTYDVLMKQPRTNRQETSPFQNNSTFIRVGVSQVHALTGKREVPAKKIGRKASGCGVACQWWPLLVGTLLLLATCGVGAGAFYLSRKPKKAKRKRGAKPKAGTDGADAGAMPDSTPSSTSTLRAVDVQGVPGSAYSTASRQETWPLMGNFYPQPMGSAGFNGVSPYASRQKGGEFYV